MTFLLRKKGANAQIELKTIANSEVLRPGEAVRLASGNFVTCPAGSSVYGVVQSIVGKNGEVLRNNGAGADFDPTGDYTAASDNATVGLVKAQVLVNKDAIYSVSEDDTLGTTTGSGLAGYYMDHTSGALVLDESTAATSSAQWVSHGVDPEDSTRVLVSIYEHQLDA